MTLHPQPPEQDLADLLGDAWYNTPELRQKIMTWHIANPTPKVAAPADGELRRQVTVVLARSADRNDPDVTRLVDELVALFAPQSAVATVDDELIQSLKDTIGSVPFCFETTPERGTEPLYAEDVFGSAGVDCVNRIADALVPLFAAQAAATQMSSLEISNLRRACRAYPGDTDTFRVSQHRLEEFVAKRDAAMLEQITAIRKELKEQKTLVEAITKYGKEATAPKGKDKADG
jgi:hypothetical protein